MCAYLSQHPEVFFPRIKEPHFFGSDLVFKRPRMTKEQYLALFSQATGEKRVGEGSVWYLFSRVAAREIKDFCPSAKIIIMVRNPVDMMYSLHSQRLYGDDECVLDFAEALAAEEDRKRGLRLYQNARNHMGFFYREAATYTPQIRRYLDVFDRGQVKIIVFDDLRHDMAQVYREVCQFLEVRTDFRPRFVVVNPNKQVRSHALRSLLRYTPKGVQWLSRTLVPHQLRRKVRKGMKQFNTVYTSRPPLAPELRRRLQAEFLGEVERLSEMIGRDLTHWCRDEAPSHLEPLGSLNTAAARL
jgi:hypothetical protein